MDGWTDGRTDKWMDDDGDSAGACGVDEASDYCH